MWERRTSELAQNVVVGLFPTWNSTIDEATLSPPPTPSSPAATCPRALRRLISEGRADVRRALRARAADAAARSDYAIDSGGLVT